MEGEEEMQLTPAQEAHLLKCFEDLDKDASGRLEPSETMTFLQMIGMNPTPDEVNERMAKVDADGDKALDFEEFKTLVCPLIQDAMQHMRSSFKEAFDEIDKDGSGKIEKEELREYLKNNGKDKLEDEQIDELFEAVDVDDDGKIDMDEMTNLFCAVLEEFAEMQDAQESQEADS